MGKPQPTQLPNNQNFQNASKTWKWPKTLLKHYKIAKIPKTIKWSKYLSNLKLSEIGPKYKKDQNIHKL